MIFLGVVGGVIVAAVGLAAWYDHAMRRRGEQVDPAP
jgi:hypothetical protein